MPIARYALAAAAACLIGGAAFAQPSNMTNGDAGTTAAQPPDATSQNGAPAAPASDGTGAAVSSDNAGASTGMAANTSATVDANGVQVIASQPVPDTPANRKAYGQPMSRAGKRTAPAGN